jgi:hypothetical protein
MGGIFFLEPVVTMVQNSGNNANRRAGAAGNKKISLGMFKERVFAFGEGGQPIMIQPGYPIGIVFVD